jgi:transposase
MEDRVTLSQKQLKRWHLLKMVLERRIGLKGASEQMEVSYRHAKRLKHAVVRDGPEGLIHGNTGRKPVNVLEEQVKDAIVSLSKTQYAAFNDVHFTEKLATEEGIGVSRETVRRIRRKAGIAPKRRRKAPRHRARRDRKPQEGMMVLWDGSPHRWFGDHHPPCCLMLAVDDATTKGLAARFFPFESTEGYLWLLKRLLRAYGIPLAIYQDRNGALKRNDDNWSLEEQLKGEQDPTQVGWALRELSIRPIYALSPQAKGRIERTFGTFQDRLIAEMEKADIQDIERGNGFLEGEFLKSYNDHFAKSPAQSQKAWRTIPKTFDVDRVCSFRYEAIVGNDNTVRLGGITIDIPPGPSRFSYAKARVEVRQLLDGSWRVYYRGTKIANHPATELREPIRALKRRKKRARATIPYSLVYAASDPEFSP